MIKGFETRTEKSLAKREEALTSPADSRHLATCAKTLGQMQHKVLRTVMDARKEAIELMADAPPDDLQRVLSPLFRLTLIIAGWDSYVSRLIDNDFEFSETPYIEKFER